MAGKNTLGAPPRLADVTGDVRQIADYIEKLYRALVLDGRVLTRLAELEGALARIADVLPPPETASPSYDPAEMTAALAAIRAILTAAKEPA